MKTKIIATIGPASKNKIPQLCKAGMNIARVNTKYGKEKEYEKVISSLRKTKCRIMFDIKGRKMISWLKKKDFDYIAVSFAQTAKQIKEIRKEFFPRRIRIISKIENRTGFNNLAELIRESDGIMVARGDLGRHVPFEEVPINNVGFDDSSIVKVISFSIFGNNKLCSLKFVDVKPSIKFLSLLDALSKKVSI